MRWYDGYGRLVYLAKQNLAARCICSLRCRLETYVHEDVSYINCQQQSLYSEQIQQAKQQIFQVTNETSFDQ